MLFIVVTLNFNLLHLLIVSGLIVSLPLEFCLVSLAAGSGWGEEGGAGLLGVQPALASEGRDAGTPTF